MKVIGRQKFILSKVEHFSIKKKLNQPWDVFYQK